MTGQNEAETLSIGVVYGGTAAIDVVWKPAIQRIMKAVITHREGRQSPLCVNVVFHVDGEHLPPVEFEGVRTGRLSRKRMELMVQAAVPPEPVVDRCEVLLGLLREAVAEAEALARRKGIADDLNEIRAVVEAVVHELAAGP